VQDQLGYERLVEVALRGVVRDALSLAEENPLPGDHHFYITFRTTYPGVEISPTLLGQHPEDMTIVLQHQFWDLQVEKDLFRVTLSFNRVHETLVIPYEAVIAFRDPSINFALHFSALDEDLADIDEDLDLVDDTEVSETQPDLPTGEEGNVVALDAFRKKS